MAKKALCTLIITTLVISIISLMTYAESRYLTLKEHVNEYYKERENAYFDKTDNRFPDIVALRQDYFDSYPYSIDISTSIYIDDDIQFRSGYYFVRVYENIFITWTGEEPLLQSSMGIYHLLKMQDDYSISEETSYCSFLGFENDEATFFSEGLVLFQQTINETYNQNSLSTIQEKAFEELRTTSYSPLLASSYALDYALSYNPNYVFLGHWDEELQKYVGNDCANFVSQCIYAGNVEMNSSWFHYSTNNYSSSWTSCTLLRSYLKNISGATYINNPTYNDIKFGDILFYDKYKDGCECTCYQCQAMNCEECVAEEHCTGRIYNHTMICTGTRTSDGRPIFCGHTDHIRNMCINLTPETKAYSVIKIHMIHAGTWHRLNNTYHQRYCSLCNYYEYQQHVPFLNNGMLKCSICNASGPFQLILE